MNAFSKPRAAPATICARTWDADEGGAGSTEMDCIRRPVLVEFNLAATALIVIDPWADHHNEGWFLRAATAMNSLVRLIKTFRTFGRPIFYDPSGRPMHPAILAGAGRNDIVIPWDNNGGGTAALNQMLIDRGVRTLFWAGFAANICLMGKPCGFRAIMRQDWDRQHFLVRDATIAHESAETFAEQRLLDATCYEVEYYPLGFTTLVSEVAAAFQEAHITLDA